MDCLRSRHESLDTLMVILLGKKGKLFLELIIYEWRPEFIKKQKWFL